jgi:hypothetical protein
MPGTIIIRPIQAKLEINDGLIKKLDPYCIAVIGNTIAKSSVCKKGGKTPQWKDSLTLSHADEPFCFLQVKDSNILKDRKLGSCTIDLEDTLTSVFSQRWYELYDHERPVGEILIEAKAGRDYNHNDDIPVEHIVAQKSDRLLKKWREQQSQLKAQRKDSAEPDVVRNISKELLFHSANSGNSGSSKDEPAAADQEIAKESQVLLGSPPQQEIPHEINDLYKRNKAQELADNIKEMDESLNLVTEIRERPVIPDSITVNASHRKFSNEFTPKKATFVRISQKGPGSLKKNTLSPRTANINLNSTDLASPSPQIIPIHSYQSPQITSKTQSRHHLKPKFLTDFKASREEFPRKKLFHHTEKKPFRALILGSNKKKTSSFCGNYLPVARTPEQKKVQQGENVRPPTKPVFNWDEYQLQKEDYILPSVAYKMRKNEQKMRKSEETMRSPLEGCSSPRAMIPKIDVKKRKQDDQNAEKKILPSTAYYMRKSEDIKILRAMIPKVEVKKRKQESDKENVQNEANKAKYFGSPTQEKIHEKIEYFRERFDEHSTRLKKDLDFEMKRFSYKKERYDKEQKVLTERKQAEALHEGEKMKEGLRSLNYTPAKGSSGFTSPKSEKTKLKKIAYRTYVECHGDDDEGNCEENLWDLKGEECK